jgi:aspartate aminotransferase-like enzyme
MSYYFNFNKYSNNNRDISLPFTPNIISLKQLHYQLEYFKKTGLGSRIQKIRMRALYFRELIEELPFEIIAQNPSNCGTALYTKRTDVKDLFERLQKKNIYFTPSGGREGKKLIISHIGEQDSKDVNIIVNELRKWLRR